MKLSIVTINYNNAEGLERTLNSVLTQSYNDIEHIIVDGASTDGSVHIIKDYVQKVNSEKLRVNSVVWTSENDNGIYNAMNKGIRKATGEYIQILNSGDILAADDVTEKMVSAVKQCECPPIVYGNMLRDYGNGKLNRDIFKAEGIAREVEWTMYDFIQGTVNHDPTYIRADIYMKYGLYDEGLKIVSDWKWFVNAVVFGGEKLYYVPIDVTIFDTTGVSETNLAAREKERRTEMVKLLPSAILKDYDTWHFPISQIKRLNKHHLWGLVYFMERVLFKFEKWKILK